jgi:hypothetical protein
MALPPLKETRLPAIIGNLQSKKQRSAPLQVICRPAACFKDAAGQILPMNQAHGQPIQ